MDAEYGQTAFDPLEDTKAELVSSIDESDNRCEVITSVYPQNADISDNHILYTIDRSTTISTTDNTTPALFFEIASNPTVRLAEVKKGARTVEEWGETLIEKGGERIRKKENELINRLKSIGCHEIHKLVRIPETSMKADDQRLLRVGYVVYTEIALIGVTDAHILNVYGFNT